MKKIICILIFLSSELIASAQFDSALHHRLDIYLKLNKEAKFEELLHYVHPSLFALIPRENCLTFFRRTYDNELMHLSIDSTAVINSSAEFREGNTTFRKIEYWMGVTVTFKAGEAVNQPDFFSKTSDLLKVGFPNSQISYNKNTKSFFIGTASLLIALKDDNSAPWMFLGYNKNEAFLKRLFPASVIQHFQLL